MQAQLPHQGCTQLDLVSRPCPVASCSWASIQVSTLAAVVQPAAVRWDDLQHVGGGGTTWSRGRVWVPVLRGLGGPQGCGVMVWVPAPPLGAQEASPYGLRGTRQPGTQWTEHNHMVGTEATDPGAPTARPTRSHRASPGARTHSPHHGQIRGELHPESYMGPHVTRGSGCTEWPCPSHSSSEAGRLWPLMHPAVCPGAWQTARAML